MEQRIYIIGTGTIAGHHAMAARAMPNKPKLYAADPNPAAREKFAADYPEAELFESSDEMLAHTPAEALDIVCVATPPLFHKPEAIKALESGRHVVLEKPFTMNVDEAEEVYAVAQKVGKSIACCSNRFIGWELNQKVAEIIASGGIGKPYLVEWAHRTVCNRPGLESMTGVWWFADKSRSSGGVVADWGPYDFGVLFSIFKPVKVTVSQAMCVLPDIPAELPEGVTYDIETHAIANLEFTLAGGERVLVKYERSNGTHGDPVERELICGTEKSIQWNWLPFGENLKIDLNQTVGKEAVETETIQGPSEAYPEGDSWIEAPIREFDRYIRGEAGAKVFADADALKPFRILRAVYDAAESGQPVTVEF